MKTGLFIQPINEPILKKIMEDNSFTKISPAINFVLQEYNKMVYGKKTTIVTDESKPKEVFVKEESRQEISKNYNNWFVAEEK